MSRSLCAWFKTAPVTIRAAIITGIIIVVCTVVAEILNPIVSTLLQEPKSDLRLVDLSILEAQSQSHPFPNLDIKVRNAGAAPGFIKRVHVHVKKIWTLQPLTEYVSFAVPSHSYQVELPLAGAPYQISVDVAQSVGSGEVDRFNLDLGNREALYARKEYVFLVQLTLVYDEKNKSLRSQDVLFSTIVPGAEYRPTVRGDLEQVRKEVKELAERQKQVTLRNKRVAEELLKIEGARKADRLKENLETIRQVQLTE